MNYFNTKLQLALENTKNLVNQDTANKAEITYSSDHGYGSPVVTTYVIQNGKPISATAVFPDGSKEYTTDASEAKDWFDYDDRHGTIV